MIRKLRSRFLPALVLGCALSSGLALKAAPVLLYVGGSVPVGTPSAIADGTPVSGGSHLESFSVAGLTGQLGVTILSGVSANPNAGGLTFVYELANLNVDPDTDGDPANDGDPEVGVLNWVVGPFDFTTTYFELGSSFFFSPNDTPVMPELAIMDPSGTVTVTYPIDIPAPPIFHEENTWQMIFHTNATAWAETDTSMHMWKDDFSAFWTISGIPTLTPAAAVPDDGATLLPLAFVLLALHRFPRRR